MKSLWTKQESSFFSSSYTCFIAICSKPRARRGSDGTQETILPLPQAVTVRQAPCPATGDEEEASQVLLVFKGDRR